MADIPASELRGYFAQLPEIESRLNAIEDKLNDKVDVQLTGSKAILATEPFPSGEQGDTLMVYDETTGDAAVYKYISGDWREL